MPNKVTIHFREQLLYRFCWIFHMELSTNPLSGLTDQQSVALTSMSASLPGTVSPDKVCRAICSRTCNISWEARGTLPEKTVYDN
jgi:hypothetical protein